jgi:hypothetical protein
VPIPKLGSGVRFNSLSKGIFHDRRFAMECAIMKMAVRVAWKYFPESNKKTLPAMDWYLFPKARIPAHHISVRGTGELLRGAKRNRSYHCTGSILLERVIPPSTSGQPNGNSTCNRCPRILL